MESTLKELIDQFVAVRKRPLLVLNFEVDRGSMLKIHDELRGTKFDELDVMLQTGGGSIEAAFNITKVLRRHATKVNIVVPLFAKSAGTFICLGGDEVLMSDVSELGPLDPQMPESQEGDTYTHKSALNGFKALDQLLRQSLVHLKVSVSFFRQDVGLKMSDAIRHAIEFIGVSCGQLYSKMNPKEIGEYARELEVGERYGNCILVDYMKWEEQKAKRTINALVYDYPSHGYVIDLAEWQKLGFQAKELNDEELTITDKIRMLFIQQESSIIKLIKLQQTPPSETSSKKQL